MFGMRPSQKKWPDRGDVSFDDGITDARLDLSEREQGGPLSRPHEPDPPWWPLRSELQGLANRCPIPRSSAADRSGGWRAHRGPTLAAPRRARGGRPALSRLGIGKANRSTP